MNISLTPNLEIEAFAGAVVTRMASGITNGMVVKRGGDRLALTQRPSVDIFERASDHVADAKGRGIFYWEISGSLYIVNNDTVYKNSHSNAIGTISPGTGKCYMTQLDNYLILVDPENNEAYTITGADVVAKIVDVDFPATLAHGVEVMNGRCYVLDEDGFLYGSDIGNPTSWSALNYVNAERAPDGGIYIGKHYDNIVVFGPRTTEFFYDAANPAGSVLNRRQDVFFNIGCHDGQSIWQEGDRIFFIGVDPSGALGAYVMGGWQWKKISSDSMDSLLATPLVKDGYSIAGAGFTSRGHTFYMLTFYYLQGDVAPDATYVFDSTSGLWGLWDMSILGHSCFPIMNWTQRYGILPRYGEGILSNGDLITLTDDLVPQDSLHALQYLLDGYVDPGYVTNAGAEGTPIVMKVRTGMQDFGSQQMKTMKGLGVLADRTINSNTLTIRWANENSDTASFNAGRTIDTRNYQRLLRLGRFRRRNFELEYAGTDQIFLEALEWR